MCRVNIIQISVSLGQGAQRALNENLPSEARRHPGDCLIGETPGHGLGEL